jgi:hypothetical protein
MLACAKIVCQSGATTPPVFRSNQVRIKTKWNQKDRERSLSETASAVAFILWRIGQQGILNLENEGFQTDSQAQRVDIMEEFLAFLLHIVDRMTADDLSMGERQIFITALAKHLADRVQENRTDIQGSGEYRQSLIELLNRRAADYAGFSFTDGEPGYAFRRYFGENVRAVMGERDNKWITDQVMDIEVPEAMKPLRKAVNDLFPKVA